MQRKLFLSAQLILFALASAWGQEQLQPLPTPVSNNAVVGLKVSGQYLVYSMTGIGAKKTWNDTSNAAYAYNTKYETWTTLKPVPGSGRLGAVAVAVKDQIFLLGGYVPDPRGAQAIVPDLTIYEPSALRWYRGAEMPIGVRDAVAGVYRDRWIYLIGGFSMKGPSSEVQLYDTETDKWAQATPTPGAPVFGHAGGIVGDNVVYIDGATSSSAEKGAGFNTSSDCWLGKIDHRDPHKIEWTKLPPHPGDARYRIAAAAFEKDQRVYFVGGTNKVYEFDGIGLDGQPAEPSPVVFDYNLKANAWETIQTQVKTPTMDHHGLAVASDGLIVVGGMASGQKVVANVQLYPKKK